MAEKVLREWRNRTRTVAPPAQPREGSANEQENIRARVETPASSRTRSNRDNTVSLSDSGASISELESHARDVEKALQSEREAYSRAAQRVEEMHEELGQAVSERDRIQDALDNARFTDRGFGELLVRSVKNEVGALDESADSTARTARLMEFMGKVLQAHSELRGPNTENKVEGGGERSGSRNRESEDSEDSEYSPENSPEHSPAPAQPPMRPPRRLEATIV